MSLPLWVFGRQMKWHGRMGCVAYSVQRWLSRNTSRSQVGQRCSIRTPPPAYPIFWTSIPLAAIGVHAFAASFIYMNGDKPRSEYYHLRSICCYTTDFELNLQNEKNKYKPTVFAFITRALCRRKVRKDETDLFPVKSRRFTWKQKTKIQRTMRLHHRTIWPWCCSCSKDMGSMTLCFAGSMGWTSTLWVKSKGENVWLMRIAIILKSYWTLWNLCSTITK